MIGTKALEQPDTSTLVLREEQPAKPNASSNIQEVGNEITEFKTELKTVLFCNKCMYKKLKLFLNPYC